LTFSFEVDTTISLARCERKKQYFHILENIEKEKVKFIRSLAIYRDSELSKELRADNNKLSEIILQEIIID